MQIVAILFTFFYAHLLMLFQAAQAGTKVAVGTTLTSQINFQVLAAFVISGLIHFAKKSPWQCLQWINDNRPRLLKLLSCISAMLLASGIAISHSGSFSSEQGVTITIAGLSYSALGNFFATWLGQWGGQHVLYEAIFRKASVENQKA